MRRTIVGSAVILVVLAGCGSSGSKRTAAVGTTTSAPATTVAGASTSGASTTVASGPPACTTAGLSIAAGPGQAAAGHGGVALTFTNRSGSTCRISGYPGVALLDASGHKIADAARTPSGYLGGLASSSDAPPILELRQGETASALVEGTSQANGGGSCPGASALEVTPPAETHSVRLTAGLSGCSPQVHPVVPGPTGRAGQ